MNSFETYVYTKIISPFKNIVCRIKHWQCLSFEYSYTQILKATSSCLRESGAEKDKPQQVVLFIQIVGWQEQRCFWEFKNH